MKLLLQRFTYTPNSTIGKLYIDNTFICDTLEPTYRDLSKEAKVMGSTAIPVGIYKVVMSYSNRFRRILPELIHVPHFEAIRIHSGNNYLATQGCILVGELTKDLTLINSRLTLQRLLDKLKDCQDVNITIMI